VETVLAVVLKVTFFSSFQYMHHPRRNVKTAKGNMKSTTTLFRFVISFLAAHHSPTWNKVCWEARFANLSIPVTFIIMSINLFHIGRCKSVFKSNSKQSMKANMIANHIQRQTITNTIVERTTTAILKPSMKCNLQSAYNQLQSSSSNSQLQTVHITNLDGEKTNRRLAVAWAKC